MKSAILTSTPLVAAIAWTIALVIDPGRWEQASILLIGLGLLSMASVSVVGIVLSGGRWARNLAFTATAAGLLIAVVRPLDAMWIISVVLTMTALVALFVPVVNDRIRKLPSASGPPPRAVLMPAILLAAPFLIGFTSQTANSWLMVFAGMTALVAAFLYMRVVPGGLIAVRIIWPVIALGVAPLLGIVGGATAALLGLVVAVIAWHPSVKVAFYPPTESGSAYPIPPELAPQEVLDAAQIDDRGTPI